MTGEQRTVRLSGGALMPRVGFGTSPMTSEEAAVAVKEAIGLGYRLIDTAFAYKNEEGVGRAIASSEVPREELFVTTKFNAESHGVDLVREAWAGSVERLGLDYLDLLLIHWPNPGRDRFVDAWRGLIKLRDEGMVRSIGVSNFKPGHIDRIIEETGVAPEVNQVQLSPYLTRQGTRSYDAQHGVVTESWSPIGAGGGLLEEPAILDVADRHGRTPAQIVLRWHLELGLVVIPKTSSGERMAENLDVFDFALGEEEIAALSSLDRGEAAAVDSDAFGH